MGKYIEKNSQGEGWPSATGKADFLIADGAKEVSGTEIKFQPFLICVVENGPFDAAAYVDTRQEFEAFQPDFRDGRPRRWLVSEAIVKANYPRG